jgi:hypothetical protein
MGTRWSRVKGRFKNRRAKRNRAIRSYELEMMARERKRSGKGEGGRETMMMDEDEDEVFLMMENFLSLWGDVPFGFCQRRNGEIGTIAAKGERRGARVWANIKNIQGIIYNSTADSLPGFLPDDYSTVCSNYFYRP